jgi:hypothetical protein
VAAIISLALVTGFACPAEAQKRVALIVGNSAYGHQADLPNVPNDAAAMEALFMVAQFDVVDVKHNLGVAALRRALKEFAGRAADADVAVFFYAGHGIEVSQVNYLIPTDAKLATDFDVEDEAVSLDRVLQAMEPAKRLRLVILDACRENPFVKSMRRTVAARSVGRGLARVEPSTSNTLIAYATRPNAVAEDGAGPNSPFTAALVNHLLRPGLDLRIALGRVRDEVLASTADKQEPYVTGSVGGDIVSLIGGVSSPPQQMPGTHEQPNVEAAVAKLRYGMRYTVARAILLDGGWQPIHGYKCDYTPGPRIPGPSDICRKAPELQYCAGSGTMPCRFEFVEAGGKRLVVATSGEVLFEELPVVRWYFAKPNEP